ncbi:glycoside hydrolase family 3 N-terminal domain-containing protein [Thalassomonas sp. M1454]|uniref:glycoside hydrolase family 3 N-terminal domain-containing protein n=1 Tax=Thalassomonas sp. M1454 TaxID=2594477 RepID=UPI00117C0E66|nr:glycoside hydrolase family 3 N-terminal domain-containing protein [Thalassomonas sp. M1454]TRX54961.1 beta-glucosidase [Thalassomonas sp. M1454]
MFTKLKLITLSLCLFTVQALAADKATEDKIKKLIASMSIEEKVGQMTQLDVREVSVTGPEGVAVVKAEKLKKIIHKYKAGSILNAAGQPMNIEQWGSLISAIQDEALSTEHQIPILYGIDSIHGVTYTAGSTLFPHNIGLAASLDLELSNQIAKVTAMETRASGIRWNFDPVLDIGRQPLWSRFEETFGEDPYIVEQMAVGMVKAYEQDGLDKPTAVASTMKHFVGYSAPDNGKDRTPATISDKDLWEYYLPQFQAAVDAGSSTIMINSASINGVPVHASKHLLQDVLRDKMGFKGLIVTDWEDIIRLHTRHRIAATPREAVKIAIDAGIDMSMVPNEMSFFEHLTDLVKSGEISEQRINESVAIILRLKFELGLFDNPYPEQEAIANFGKKQYQDLALESARATMTLLKNETLSKASASILPLTKNDKVLIAGPGANNLGPLHGSWSYSWQGSNEERYPESTLTLVEAFQAEVGADNVTSFAFTGYDNLANYDTDGLAKAAENVDYIVLALGEGAYAESPGALDDLTLDKNQIELAKAAALTGKPVILVLLQGRPRIVKEIEPAMKAILLAYRPGSKGAEAIVDTLYGKHNPSGVLPFSYPQFTGDHSTYDRNFLTNVQQLNVSGVSFNGHKPQWKFGFGLSYSNFTYSKLSLNKSTYSADDKISVSVQIKNTGDKAGEHAVQLFLSDLYASESPDFKRLKRFSKVKLKPGQSKTVKFELTTKDLSFVNSALERVVEDGEFKIAVGDLTKNFNYKK